MNNKIFSIAILILLLASPILAISKEDCQQKIDVLIQFKAFDAENSDELSKYQAPDYKEDDLLGLWKLIIINEGNCSSDEAIFEMDIATPDETIDHFFCNYQITIPPIELGGIYYVEHKGLKDYEVGEDIFRRRMYTDSNGKNLSFCRIRMLTPGLWKIDPHLISSDPTKTIHQIGYSVIDDEYNREHLDFKVRDKSEVLFLELQKNTVRLSIISIIILSIIGVMTIIVQICLARWQIKKQEKSELDVQRDLIKSIRTQVGVIRQDIIGHKTELNKKPPVIPSYFISDIDSRFYVTRLKSSLNGLPTEKLKESLICAEDKVRNINRLLQLAQESRGREQIKFMEEIKDQHFKYHSHLKNLLDDISKETGKFGLLP